MDTGFQQVVNIFGPSYRNGRCIRAEIVRASPILIDMVFAKDSGAFSEIGHRQQVKMPKEIISVWNDRDAWDWRFELRQEHGQDE